MSDSESWIDWYFERAKRTPSAEDHDFYFKTIKPSMSPKMMRQVAKVVLDSDNPHTVDWRAVRPAHFWLKKDQLDKRTLAAAMSNAKRLAAKGVTRRFNRWFEKQLGWDRKSTRTNIEILSEDQYLEIEREAMKGMAEDMAAGIRAFMRLMYYVGLTPGAVASLKREDLVQADGRVLIFKTGRLYDLPDHVRLPLTAWLRIKAQAQHKGHRAKSPGKLRLFRVDHHRIAGKFPKLNGTFKSLKRLGA